MDSYVVDDFVVEDIDLSYINESEVNTEEENVLKIFIEKYELLPELWNPTDGNYINKSKRNEALDKLLEIYKKIKPNSNRLDVKRKINTLRSNYRKELKKILSSKRSGSGADDVYNPTSWVFYALQFLDRIEQPVNANVRKTDENNELLDDQSESSSTTTSASRSSIVQEPPPNIQRKGRASKETDLLSKACALLNKSNNEKIPTIAIAWGEKLNLLEIKQRALAERAINDVLFEASQGTLHRNSVKINEDSRFLVSPTESTGSFSIGCTRSSPIEDHQQQPVSRQLSQFFRNFQ